jgi:hypothetical protein
LTNQMTQMNLGAQQQNPGMMMSGNMQPGMMPTNTGFTAHFQK